MATLGVDGGTLSGSPGAARDRHDGVRTVPDTYTAQAFIITDLDDNQITAFHPGAMNHSHVSRVTDVADVRLGIIAPDGKEGMQSHARAVRRCGHSFHLRSGAGPAAVRRCRARRDDRACDAI